MEEYTIGFQFQGKDVNGFDYQLFGAYQFGDFGEKEISAKAFVFTLNYNISTFLNPKIGIEFDYGSGDKNPNGIQLFKDGKIFRGKFKTR